MSPLAGITYLLVLALGAAMHHYSCVRRVEVSSNILRRLHKVDDIQTGQLMQGNGYIWTLWVLSDLEERQLVRKKERTATDVTWSLTERGRKAVLGGWM